MESIPNLDLFSMDTESAARMLSLEVPVFFSKFFGIDGHGPLSMLLYGGNGTSGI